MFWLPILDPHRYVLILFARKTITEIRNRITNTAIHNLSQYTLSYSEKKLLGLGLGFIPPANFPSSSSLLADFDSFARQLRLRWFFKDSSDRPLPKFRVPNPAWNPPQTCPPLENIISTGKAILRDSLARCANIRQNRLPIALRKAIRGLAKNDNIVLKPADKNLGLTVLDVSWYLSEGYRQLSDRDVYLSVTAVPLDELYDRLSYICFSSLCLSKDELKFILLRPEKGFRVCSLYFLPKIHKPKMVGRPICSYNGFVFEHASKWLHYKLFPILLRQKQHLKDSLTLLRDISELKFPPNVILFTFDVESLYPSIPTDEGLYALKHMIRDDFSSGELRFIMALATLILKNHYLEFNNGYWLQIRGTAMGSNFAVVYACLFLCFLENKQFSALPYSDLLYYKRYIDDAFGVWSGTELGLRDFLGAYALGLQSHIKITPTISSSSVSFLDISLFKSDSFVFSGKLSSSCYQKELNRYQYLPYSSWHPRHQKLSFIVGELRRYIMRESTLKGFLKLRLLFYQRLRARGYPLSLLRKAFSKVDYDMRSAMLESSKEVGSSGNGIPLIYKLEYTKFTKALNLGVILNPTLNRLLQKHPDLQHIPRPIICWRNSRNLRSFLVRSKISKA